jgi:predicted transcriptional regulator
MTALKSIDEDEAQRRCERIWNQIRNLEGEDAWAVLALVLARFVEAKIQESISSNGWNILGRTARNTNDSTPSPEK